MADAAYTEPANTTADPSEPIPDYSTNDSAAMVTFTRPSRVDLTTVVSNIYNVGEESEFVLALYDTKVC